MAELFIILALILLNGVFAGAEIALVSLRRTRIQQLLDEGRPGAAAVATLRRDAERLLATVQIGITIVGTTAAAIGGSSLARHPIPVIARVKVLAPYAEDIGLGVVVALISYLSLVLGELVPKSLALRAAERYALLVGRPLIWLSWIMQPLVRLLTGSSNLILKPFSDRTTFAEARLSKEELQQLVDEATRTGAVDEHTGEIASRALAFDQLLAREVMVPRSRISALPGDATVEAFRRAVSAERHSRFPVYEGALDNIVGYVDITDILTRATDGQPLRMRDLLRPTHVVPETELAVNLLKTMR